jgi:Uma2 family endonuclease
MPMPAQWMSVADYLVMEERSQIRHEYVDGYVYAISGATTPHNLIIGNLYFQARLTRPPQGCRIFMQGQKVRIASSDSIYYPDVVASCDPPDGVNGFLERPCFVIEVLSPSTARIDRTEKRDDYRTIRTLDEYVLVDQSRMEVSVYRRDSGPWPEVLDRPDHLLKLTCIGVGIRLEDIYEGIEFPRDEVREDFAVPEYATTA